MNSPQINRLADRILSTVSNNRGDFSLSSVEIRNAVVRLIDREFNGGPIAQLRASMPPQPQTASDYHAAAEDKSRVVMNEVYGKDYITEDPIKKVQVYIKHLEQENANYREKLNQTRSILFGGIL